MKLKRFFSAFIVCAVVLTAFAYTAPISAAESTPDTVAVSDYGVNDATIIQKFAADLITLSESEQNMILTVTEELLCLMRVFCKNICAVS